MPVKIRLQRHGKKGKPFYWIVAADGRAKRDGKYLEKLGTYDPNVNPAEIILDIDGAVKWLQKGAQPTDTARAILSYKGAMLKKHLAGGVLKGAFTEEQAEEKFNAWLEEKAKVIDGKRTKLSDATKKSESEALAAEKEVNKKRVADAAEAKVEKVEEETEATTEKEPVEASTEETKAPTTEEAPDKESTEETKATTTEEAPDKESKEETKATTTEEAPDKESKEETEATTTKEAPVDASKEETEATTTEKAPDKESTEDSATEVTENKDSSKKEE